MRLGSTATGDLTLLLTAIQVTSKFIATNVRKARLINLCACFKSASLECILNLFSVGLAGETNVQGEEQKKLDVLANDIMVNSLRASGKTAVLVSEELEDAIIIEDGFKGRYCVVFDPLDGSSNIDAGVNIGTIFGVYAVVLLFYFSIVMYINNLSFFVDSKRVLRVPLQMFFVLEPKWLPPVIPCAFMLLPPHFIFNDL